MSGILLHDRFSIDPSQPLPELNTVASMAYRAQDLMGAQADTFALVCKLSPGPRLDDLRICQGLLHPSLTVLLDWQALPWPHENSDKSMILVYQGTLGKRHAPPGSQQFMPISEERLMSLLIRALDGLSLLHKKNVFHRNIRPDNLFWSSQNSSVLVLGEFLSMPPGYAQPLFVETIESMMCHPLGRGPGGEKDDLYALAATLLAGHAGHPLMGGLSLEDQLHKKIDLGSYDALTGSLETVPQSLAEFFKGALADDPRDQWSLEDAQTWAQDRRKKAKIPHMKTKASKSFVFLGKKYKSPREMAFAIQKNWKEAKAELLEGDFDYWLSHDVKDTGSIKNYVEARNKEKRLLLGSKQSIDLDKDVSLARLCAILDPNGPIHWKGFAVMPNGYGPFLLDMVLAGESIAPVIECLKKGGIFYDAESSNFSKACVQKYRGFFDRLRYQLSARFTSFANEKCVYLLNPYIPCISPHLRANYIYQTREILRGLEEAMSHAHKNAGLEFIDPYLVSFIIVRLPEIREADLAPLFYGKQGQGGSLKSQAVLNMFFKLQQGSPLLPVPNLTRWIFGITKSVIHEYKSKYNRTMVEKAAEKAIERGDIVYLTRVLLDPVRLARDMAGFRIARGRYRKLALLIQHEGRTILNNQQECLNRSQYIAFNISIALTFVVSIVGAVLYFSS